jgi:hypothetical protein
MMREPAEEQILQPVPKDDKVMARGGKNFWNVAGNDGGEIIIFRFGYYCSRCDVCRLVPT